MPPTMAAFRKEPKRGLVIVGSQPGRVLPMLPTGAKRECNREPQPPVREFVRVLNGVVIRLGKGRNGALIRHKKVGLQPAKGLKPSGKNLPLSSTLKTLNYQSLKIERTKAVYSSVFYS
jgi:hypothetical protein